ncbi:MAG: hypothetical protein J0H71_05685 [Rhizobiales bacterium]|nr:hypothetical protein [Hyphomicrobiales bacterium]
MGYQTNSLVRRITREELHQLVWQKPMIRLKEIEEKRWTRFQEFSSNWDARAKLLNFITEIEARIAG